MTAVPAAVGAGVQLICDGCGRVADADGCGLLDAEVVYVAVAEIGWTGSAFARGPHRCPGCGIRVPPGPEGERRPENDGPVIAQVSQQATLSAAVVRVVGDVDIDVVGELRTALEHALDAHRRVVVDLTRSATIGSVGLGAILRARQSARRRGGDLLLVAPSGLIRTVLRAVRLDAAFRVFDTVPQALSAPIIDRQAVASQRQQHPPGH